MSSQSSDHTSQTDPSQTDPSQAAPNQQPALQDQQAIKAVLKRAEISKVCDIPLVVRGSF